MKFNFLLVLLLGYFYCSISFMLNSTINFTQQFLNLTLPQGQKITGIFLKLFNSQGHVSVELPQEGCNYNSTVTNTSKFHQCKIAINAGFFKVNPFAGCIGDLICENQIQNNDPSTNNYAHFGVYKNNFSYYFGYLQPNISQNELLQFQSLVTGRGWLVKNGTSYISQAAEIENISSSFIQLIAPRIVLGIDDQNNFMILSVNGYESLNQGIDLEQLTQLCMQLGFYQAINLDGGGSLTYAYNNLVLNTCSDKCTQSTLNEYGPCSSPLGTNLEVCERQVTSIICIK